MKGPFIRTSLVCAAGAMVRSAAEKCPLFEAIVTTQAGDVDVLKRGIAAAAVAVATLIAVAVVAVPGHAASFTTVTAYYGSNHIDQRLTIYQPVDPGPHPAILF